MPRAAARWRWWCLSDLILAWRQGRWRVERKSIWILLSVDCSRVSAAGDLLPHHVATRGVKGSQMWSVDLKFVLYVFYELTGMGGIGLSPLEIRSLARSPPHLAKRIGLTHLPQLILPLLLGNVRWPACCSSDGLRRQWRARAIVSIDLRSSRACAAVDGVLVFVVGSLVLQKAFWARH